METSEIKKDWLKQLEEDIIPWAEGLLVKEKEHNTFLRESKTKLENKKSSFFLPWISESTLNVDEISEMIRYSDNMVKHIEFRIEEYKQFLTQRKKEYGI